MPAEHFPLFSTALADRKESIKKVKKYQKKVIVKISKLKINNSSE